MTDTLYPTYTTPKTLSQIKARTDWKGLDAEFAHRVEALMVASGGTIGFGGGSRTTEGQTALFLSRYHEDPNGVIYWNGKRWTKNPGVATAAPPGRSYHEPTTEEGKALAADLVAVAGNFSFVHNNAHLYGLVDFALVNAEPWHVQPLEIPHARSEYSANYEPLEVWSTSGNTDPQPVEDDMRERIQVPGDAAVFLLDGITCTWVADTAVSDALISAGLMPPAGNTTMVQRAALKAFELRGPLPNNNVTKATDFAKWSP
jgi:hypothetical protein